MGDAGWRRRRPRRLPYLGHLRPQVDLLQVDGVRPEIVEQLAEQDSIAEGLRQVEHLRRVPGHPVVGRQHLAVDEPLRALLPRLHARRLRDAARPGQEARMRPPPPRFLHAPPTPAAARPCPAGVRAPRPPGRGLRAGLGSGPGPAPPPPPGRSCSESRALSVRPGRLRGGSAQASDSRARRPATEHAQRAGRSRCRLRVPRGAVGERRRPGLGSVPGAGEPSAPAHLEPAGLRSAHPPHPSPRGRPGIFPSGRLPGLGKVGLNTNTEGLLQGSPYPRWGLQFFKGSQGSERLIGAPGLPREMKKGPRAS